MQKALDIIQKHAKELKKLEQSEQYLFETLNNISPQLQIVYITEYDFVKTDFSSTRFQPVNLLRYDVLNRLQDGEKVSPDTIEEIKTKIIEKDESYFLKYGDKLVNALKNYPQKRNRRL
jgi:5-methylcytosine-specific restriction protein B